MSIIDSSENQKIILATVHVNLFCISLISLNCLVTYWIMFAKSIKHINIDDWYCINTHQPKSTTHKKKSNLLMEKTKTYFVWFGGRPFCWWMERESDWEREKQTLLLMDEESERLRERKGEALAKREVYNGFLRFRFFFFLVLVLLFYVLLLLLFF